MSYAKFQDTRLLKEIPEDWSIVKFTDIMQDVSAGNDKVKRKDFKNIGKFPIVDQGQQLISGYTDTFNPVKTKGPYIVFGDHTRILKYIDFPFIMGADGVKVLTCKSHILTKYIYYFLNSIEIPHTGYNRHYKFLKDIQIPLPSLEEQKRIVDILDKAQELINLKEEALNASMKLEESLFYEIFGDPRSNKNNWSLRTLKDVSEKFSDGPFGSNLKTEHYTTDGVRVIRLQNIGKGSFVDENKSFISEEHFKKLKKHKCEPNDVLIATIGNPNLRACLLPEFITEAINKADCIQCRPDQRMVLPEYICSLLNTRAILDSVSNLIHGQTRSRISMGQLSKLEILVPPIELQKNYRKAIKKVIIKKQKTNESLFGLQNLFQSLLQRAFKGELTKQKVR